MIINDEKFADRFLAYTHCGKYILESMMSVAGKIFLLEVSDQNIWRMENIFMFLSSGHRFEFWGIWQRASLLRQVI